MFEESISIWASMNSWCTPTVLFLFVNLVIGTLVITSSLANAQKHNEDQKQQQQPLQPLATSPSVLQRLKSINFYNYRSPEPATNYASSPDFNSHYTSHYEQHQQQQQQPYSGTLQQEQQQQQQQQPYYFSRSPSVLQRLKSINLYSYLSQEATSPSTTTISTVYKNQETETAQYQNFQQTHEQEPDEDQEEEEELQLEQELEDELDEEVEQEEVQTLDEVYGQLQDHHVTRTKSDTKPASGEVPTKLSRKMRKSASATSTFAHFAEEDIVENRRPATVREGKSTATPEVADDEVDAKADDFINKFKRQLKLQRVDSIMRYKEMINRGSAK